MVRELSDHSSSPGNDAAAGRRAAGARAPDLAPGPGVAGAHGGWWSQRKVGWARARQRVREYFDASPSRSELRQLAQSIDRHRTGRTANAMAFDLFLALIPMLALAGWALTQFLVSGKEALEASSLLADLTPDQLRGIIQSHFQSLSAASLAPVATIGGWWLASSAFHTMIRVFEEAFDCKRRPWWRSRLLALGYALAGMAVFVVSCLLGMTLTTPPGILGDLMVQLRAHGLLRHTFVLTGLLVMTGFFSLLYGIAIKRQGIRRRRVWPGAALAAGLGSGASLLLGYFTSQLTRYTLFYGSLATVAILLLWLWFWCAAILLGAEVNVYLENRAQRERR